MDDNIIDYGFVLAQIRHWLNTPANGYLGSDYGIDLKQYLHKPVSRFEADAIIEKMRADIPALALVADGLINIFSEYDDADGVRIWIQVSDKVLRAV